MKFFTPELIERYGSVDPTVARAAEAEWETVHARYVQHLQTIEAGMPPHLREFSSLLLHDATVQALARDKGRLIMVLKKDIPPRDLAILCYELTDEPVILPFGRHPGDWDKPTAFDFDELDQVRQEEQTIYTQSIVFGNGWELQLRFRDVQVILAEPWAPSNGAIPAPVAPSALSPPN